MGVEFEQACRFGVATAAYQIEGAVEEGGRGPSIWDTFSHTAGKTDRGETGDLACDHYHRMEEDLDHMARLGVDSYRFSIAWSRIQAKGTGSPNRAGLDFYSRLVDGLLERGITAMATLYHWDLPQALEDKGGWRDRDTAYRFADYAEIMVGALGDRVADWVTLNEPWCSAMLGYASGVHAPGVRSKRGAVTAAHHLNLAHGMGVQALRAETSARVGVALNLHQFYPASDSEADMEALAIAQATANLLYIEPMMEGRYADATTQALSSLSWDWVRDGDLDLIHQPIDFLGLNYYAPSTVRAGATPQPEPTPWVGAEMVTWIPPRGPLTQMGWGIDPDSMTDLLVDVHRRYPGLDLVVTENGAAMPDRVGEDGVVHDQDRIDYLDSHLRAIHAAMDQGVPVRGYYVWSLMDNFEWAYGLEKRFGLIRVDYDTCDRTWKDSARWYQQFLATRTLP
ncbi:MAG: GH1 family beta-glucosidase [Propionibacteriaceae bacterium]|nr:GH1 family beta-glucosidase [Propionibacteriaceae bacterium]